MRVAQLRWKHVGGLPVRGPTDLRDDLDRVSARRGTRPHRDQHEVNKVEWDGIQPAKPLRLLQRCIADVEHTPAGPRA